MLIDARNLENEFTHNADICIVGTGAAGLTLASALSQSKLSICLVESGAFEPERATQDLYRGAYAGDVPSMRDSYLSESRLRYFGGTTNHWGGYCRPLEEIDFEERSWVPNSGWPFPKTYLAPFYRRASEFMQMGAFDEDPGASTTEKPPLSLENDIIESRLFRFNFRRFGPIYRKEVTDSANVRLLYNANVVEIVDNKYGRAIDHVRVATLTGIRGVVRSRIVVLAAGGIENARLLLASNRNQAKGIGNGRDLVGRYFMEHLVTHAGTGPVVLWPEVPVDRYQFRNFSANFLYLSAHVLRERRLLTVALQLWQADDTTITPFDRALVESCFEIDHAGKQGARDMNPQVLKATYLCEQQPNPDSRVTLGNDKDALGMQRVRLQWKLSGAEMRSIYEFINVLQRRVASSGYGRIKNSVPPGRMSEIILWGNHHMGTTRMHADPTRGVVDSDCRVHGVDNLYIAGSSVFPTVGAANPTFTIVALALRLADHLVLSFGTP